MPADVVLENYQGSSSVEEITEDFDVPETPVRTLLECAAKRNKALRL